MCICNRPCAFAASIHPTAAAAAQEQRELPVAGGTRILLSSGGTITRLLTAAEFVTITITGLPASTTEQHLRHALGRFGHILRVCIFRTDSINQQQQRQQQQQQKSGAVAAAGSPGQPTQGSCWARVSFKEPDEAAAAVAAATELKPWVVKGSRPPAVVHSFMQLGAL
jgi:hypothetical protein